jgi:hypothetical protein
VVCVAEFKASKQIGPLEEKVYSRRSFGECQQSESREGCSTPFLYLPRQQHDLL